VMEADGYNICADRSFMTRASELHGVTVQVIS